MKVDLTKPIRCCDGRPANYLRDTPDGKRIIEWRSLSGDCWYVDAHWDVSVDILLENIPPEPRKVKVWAVWTDARSTAQEPFLARDKDDAKYFRAYGHRVTEHEIEEPTP